MKTIVRTRSFKKEEVYHVAAEATNEQFISVNQASSQRVLARKKVLRNKLGEEQAKQRLTH